MRKSSATTTATASSAAASLLPLTAQEVELHTKRITQEDLEKVTVEDINNVVASMTPQQFAAAMKAMAEQNKYSTVVASAHPAVMGAATSHVKKDHMREAAKWIMQLGPFAVAVGKSLNDDPVAKKRCEEHLERRKRLSEAEQ